MAAKMAHEVAPARFNHLESRLVGKEIAELGRKIASIPRKEGRLLVRKFAARSIGSSCDRRLICSSPGRENQSGSPLAVNALLEHRPGFLFDTFDRPG